MVQTESEDGKATAGFLMAQTESEGMNDFTWDKVMLLVGWNVLVVTLMLPLKVLCCNPSKKGLYRAMLWLQLIGGGLTEAASIFVAILGGDLVPTISSWFGLYSIWIGMAHALAKLKKFRQPRVVESSDLTMSCSVVMHEALGFLVNLYPAILFGGGVALAMWGVSFFLSIGVASYQAWLLVVFGLWLAIAPLFGVCSPLLEA